ncbi:MAG: rhomboid family intramembrane serine protease [bacterium]
MERLSMQGGWTQGARWTRFFLIFLAVIYVLSLFGFAHGAKLNPNIPVFIGQLYLTPLLVTQGNFWGLIASPWMLAPCWWQAIFHLLYLLVFGPKVEREWGSARFLRFYLLVIYLSTVLSFLIRLPSPQLAASPGATSAAGIFAVMVVYAVMWPRDRMWVFGLFPSPVAYIVMFLCAAEVIFFFLAGTAGEDFAATVLGIGLAFLAMKVPFVRGIFIPERKKRRRSPKTGLKTETISRETGFEFGEQSKSKSEKFKDKADKSDKGKRTGFLEL